MRPLTAVLPRGANQRRYVAVSLIDALGSGTFVPVSVLYLTTVVGLSPVRVGLGLALAGAAGVAATPLAGALVDRADSRLVAAVGFALCAGGYAVYAGVRSFWPFLAVATFVTVSERVASSARRIVAFSVAEGGDRVQLLAYERSTRNVGYGIGGVLATAALAGGSRDGYLAVLLLNAASFVFGAWMMLRLPGAHPGPASGRPAGGYRLVLRDRLYIALASTTSVLWLNDSLLKVGIAVWVLRRTAVPPSLVGVLFTVNTVLVVVLQVRLSRGSATVRGAGRAYGRAGAALFAACGIFALAAGLPRLAGIGVMLAAVVALTLGELLASAAEWGASIGLAREELRGRYLAVFSTGSSLQRAVGPAIVSFALVHGGRWGWLALGLALLAAGLGARSLALRADDPQSASSRKLVPETGLSR